MFVGPSPPRNRRNPTTIVSSALPDLFLAAVSLLFLCSSPRKPLPPNRVSFPPTPRRRSSTTMSRPPPRFANPQSLSDWLESRLPSDSFSTWGVKPGTKNVHNLWLELSDGETSFSDTTPPVRTVNVVTVRIIRKDGFTLVESHQELSDGSVRERNRPLSEKMKPYETPDEAVLRGIKEELGSIFNGEDDDDERIRVIPATYSTKVEERNSFSYPGLPARYALHSVDATVEGLPEEDFVTEEKEYGGDSTGPVGDAVTVKRHFWKWVSPDLVEP